VSQTPNDDRDLDAFLRRDTRLQQRWHDERGDEPSASLDVSLRAAAREAVSGRPPARPGVASRWRVPLSIAAIVVVSATVTLMVADERAHLPGDATRRPPAPSSAQQPAERSPAAAAPQEKDAVQRATSGAVAPVGITDRAVEAAKPDREEVHAPPPGAASVAEEAPAAVGSGAAAKAERRAAPPAAPEPGFVPAPPAEATGALRDEVRAQEAPARAAAPATASPRAAPELHEAPSGAAGDIQSQRESAGRARLEQAAPAAKSVQGQDAELAAEADPQRWIERIRALRAAGKLQEAEESLREFRKRYPDFRLPPDLEPAR
jgi:hypothetical protein